MQRTLLSLFSQIADRRRGQGQMYPQAPILLSRFWRCWLGPGSYRQAHAFVRTHLDRLNAAFGVSVRKAPAYTTVRFILRGLDAAQVERGFPSACGRTAGDGGQTRRRTGLRCHRRQDHPRPFGDCREEQ
jgi:hypothetical protein